MLQEAFFTALNPYDVSHTGHLWREIETAYTGVGRYYHNRKHLEVTLLQLLAVRPDLDQWNDIVLALCYHDIIYEPLWNDNEEASAALAGQRLSAAGLPAAVIDKVTGMILATKSHSVVADSDTNFFTDADLSVLGADAISYGQYAAAIRQEYAAVPDALYIPGRIKVLEHFLQMKDIYKTDHFRDLLEVQARTNLQLELAVLRNTPL